MVFISQYQLLDSFEQEDKICYNIDIDEETTTNIEYQLDELKTITPSLRYLLCKPNNDNTFYRVYINKKNKKIITKNANKFIGIY